MQVAAVCAGGALQKNCSGRSFGAPPTQRSHEPSANGQDNFIISFPRAEPFARAF